MLAYMNLDDLGKMLKKTDKQLVELLATRMEIARRVEECKRRTHDNIVRLPKEDERLRQVAEWAEKLGVSPYFAQSVLYNIIGESCKAQLIQLQEASNCPDPAEDSAAYYLFLRENLLALTKESAPTYDKEYVKPLSALHAYVRFERRFIDSVISGLGQRSLALDLGCATGHKALKLLTTQHGGFARAIGYDVSPDMIEQACKKAEGLELQSRTEFVVHDLDEGIPLDSDTADLVVISMGTAGDFHNAKKVLASACEILKPGGRVVASFYNRNAFLYRWFVPWRSSLPAEIDFSHYCLNVHGPSGKIFRVHARSYTIEEALGLFPSDLEILQHTTYPTLASILPESLLEEAEIAQVIAQADEDCAHLGYGAYLLIAAKKKGA